MNNTTTYTEIFDFDNFANTQKYKEFKYNYSTKMSKAMDISNLECLIEGIKSGLYASYDYINDGTIWVEPEGIEESTDAFNVLIKPKAKVDNNKGHYTPDELEILISYEDFV